MYNILQHRQFSDDDTRRSVRVLLQTGFILLSVNSSRT